MTEAIRYDIYCDLGTINEKKIEILTENFKDEFDGKVVVEGGFILSNEDGTIEIKSNKITILGIDNNKDFFNSLINKIFDLLLIDTKQLMDVYIDFLRAPECVDSTNKLKQKVNVTFDSNEQVGIKVFFEYNGARNEFIMEPFNDSDSYYYIKSEYFYEKKSMNYVLNDVKSAHEDFCKRVEKFKLE